jgi:hypothetical protein
VVFYARQKAWLRFSSRSLALMAADGGDAAGLTSLESLVLYRDRAELNFVAWRRDEQKRARWES